MRMSKSSKALLPEALIVLSPAGLEILQDSFEELKKLRKLNLGLNTLAMQEGRLDVYLSSGVARLEELSLEGNWYQDSQQMDSLSQSLLHFEKLKILDLKTNRFGPAGKTRPQQTLITSGASLKIRLT